MKNLVRILAIDLDLKFQILQNRNLARPIFFILK
jgi:hypothetical protein